MFIKHMVVVEVMKKIRQPGFFDIDDMAGKLSKLGDPLVGLKALVDWEAFRSILSKIHDKERKSTAGAKPYDPVLMFKVLILKKLHALSNDETEYQIRDRYSFKRFLGLQMEDAIPDSTTIWLFQELLKEKNLGDDLFHAFDEQIKTKGYELLSGQIIDATFVQVPRQRNTQEENELVKAGKTPEEWKKTPNKLRQKDVDARWTKKNKEKFYGYKNHVNVDSKTKLIQEYDVTDAAVHDSQVCEEILDYTVMEDGACRPVSGDSAYRSEEREEFLEQNNMKSNIHEKGKRNTPLTEEQKASNKEKSRIRVRIEHVFGLQWQFGGDFIRTVGKARARLQIALINLLTNILRLGQLIKIDSRKAALLKAPE